MDLSIEKLNMEGKRKEILENAVKLLEQSGCITREEKVCMLHMVWWEEG